MTNPARIVVAAIVLAGGFASTGTAQAIDAVTARIFDPAFVPPCMRGEECPAPPWALAWHRDNQLPGYPEVMRAVGIDGEVEVSFIVEPDGAVRDSSITFTRATNRAFEVSVRNAVGSWRLPLRTDGKPPEAVRTTLTVIFALFARCPGEDAPMHTFLMHRDVTRIIVMRCEPELRPSH